MTDEIEWPSGATLTAEEAAWLMGCPMSEEQFMRRVLSILGVSRECLGMPTLEEMFVQDLDFPRDCPP